MTLPGPSGSTRDRGQGQGQGRGQGQGGEGCPPNATNRHHRVDFRYGWMPSPEMPRPPLPDAALPGIEEAEDEREHRCQHECHGHHPLGPRRARPRSSRVCGGDQNQNQTQNQNLNVNLNVNPNPSLHLHPAPKRSASGSTGTSSTHTYVGGHCDHCKRSHRSSGTLSGNGAPAYAYAYNHAQQAQPHPASATAGDDLPVHVPRVRQAPAGASSASARAPSARPCARPRPPEQEHERRKSWLSVLSPKKLFSFSPRKRRSVAEVDASSGHTCLTNVNCNADADGDKDENENEADFYASTSANANVNANANAELLGRTHAAHVQVRKREVHPAEWRAYGMWARPWLGHAYGDVVVRNATPSDTPRELSPPQVEEMIATLWEDERPHPERWIPHVQSAAGRTAAEPVPRAQSARAAPLYFDLRLRADDVKLGEPEPEPIPYAHLAPLDMPLANDDPTFCEGPNGAQPATYPGVPRLRIAAVAGDAQAAFPWPVTVLPHHEALPVLVADVVHALVANFEERLAAPELDALSDTRRTMVFQAYWRRMRLPVGGRTPPETDGLRRVDYLGDAICFRGLEPNRDGDGFVLFLGPPP
ncbi:hypothetical protein GSI_14301 [Ganoderma sinense ZZ0214-1]|uniref:DUF6699 domain-containing protein n=1 Tax=Ganoderma sinense ZZ0214-1 TaxID=1077348 RepID=A0A2G8RNA3_9APHY|nr:hypothetical protein GSI_14301 [Ganoderma sinense ZZ0214-1]